MDILLVGHSFIRRYRDYHARRRRSDHKADITRSQQARARHMASMMRLSHHVDGVYTHSQDIAYIHHVFHAREQILAYRPRALILDIGSNDLAHITTVQPRKMLQLASQVHTYLQNLQIPLMIVNAILPRTAGISTSPTVFSANASHYNKYLSEFCTLSPNIIFNKQRGLQYLEANQLQPVSHWSNDGIHLNQSAIKPYENRIRHCLLDNLYY